MPRVSILVPAYRPEYLDACIASALAQTYRDFELLIGDDSIGDDIAAVVSKWEDGRIRYARNPKRQEPGANRDFLIQQARGRYLKFLFDDDLLMPRSVELLCQAMEAADARLAFHGRHLMDGAGRVRPSPMAIPEGQVGLLPGGMLLHSLFSSGVNFVGEPTCIMVDAEMLRSMENPFGIGDMRMRFLTDVALYTNVALGDHQIVGIGHRCAAFRLHAGQTSANRGILAPGLFEWELMTRWSADHGGLAEATCREAVAALHQRYAEHVSEFPELEGFVALGADPDAQGRFFTPAFAAHLRVAWGAADFRKTAA